ncbi:ABC transporter permease [Microbacterium sp. NPDC058062]|uniref:ABC transporter permease n=1 Tax=Microbacterium sp. NPDC058062 TaxID=3346320 RepID=UPI0036DCC113
MLMFLLRRIASGLAMLLVITALAFSLLYLASGDVASRILGPTATQDQVNQMSEQLGLDRPLWIRYPEWLILAIQGDLGRSWFTSELVADSIGSRVAVTLSLVIPATILIGLISAFLGVAAAIYRGWIDKVVQFVGVVGFAIPSFLIALGLVILFAVQLQWLPATGFVPLSESVTGWLAATLLPVTALVIHGVAGTAQQVRGAVIDTLQQDYVRTLRSRGLRSRTIIYGHVLRNAGGPGLAVLALQFVGLLGGAVIVEQLFALPGLGQLAVSATTRGDLPQVMGVVIVIVIIVLLVNLLIDIAQGWLNPKVRIS